MDICQLIMLELLLNCDILINKYEYVLFAMKGENDERA